MLKTGFLLGGVLSTDNHTECDAIFVGVHETTTARPVGAGPDEDMGGSFARVKTKPFLDGLDGEFNDVFGPHGDLIGLKHLHQPCLSRQAGCGSIAGDYRVSGNLVLTSHDALDSAILYHQVVHPRLGD